MSFFSDLFYNASLLVDELKYLPQDFKKNVIDDNRKKVLPEIGSIVYSIINLNTPVDKNLVNIAGGPVFATLPDILSPEHSGIYVGDGQIVHLNGNGSIERVTPEIFVKRELNRAKDKRIFVSVKSGRVYGEESNAKKALSMVGKKIDYRLFTNNCHMFTYGCVSGDFKDGPPYLSSLQSHLQECKGVDEWILWDR